MSTSRRSEPSESDNGSDTQPSQLGQGSSSPMKFGLMTRSRLMGTRGLAASSIGWVLVGCIAFGFGVGALLDRQFGTAFWMPVMVMVGIAAGFREMFRTLAELNKQPSAPRKERTQSTLNAASSSSNAGRGQDAHSQDAHRQDAQSTLVEEKPRQRIFDVPPPPSASFDAKTVTQAEPKTETVDDDPEALIRRLLGEVESSDEKRSDDKPV